MSTLYAQPRGNRKKRVYMDEAATRRLRVDWTAVLRSGVGISTSTWSVEDGSSAVTLANSSNASNVATVYATTADNRRGTTVYVENKIVTDSSPSETLKRSFEINITRTR